jgi:Tat protein secretion system quality control protein TatD with DNase activity
VTAADQIWILKQHINLAIRWKRYLSIHCVSGCWQQLLQIFQEIDRETNKERKKEKMLDGENR